MHIGEVAGDNLSQTRIKVLCSQRKVAGRRSQHNIRAVKGRGIREERARDVGRGISLSHKHIWERNRSAVRISDSSRDHTNRQRKVFDNGLSEGLEYAAGLGGDIEVT